MDGRTSLAILLCCRLFALQQDYIFAEVAPTILWDPRNPIFSCDNLEIKVKVDDQLNIVCPQSPLNLGKLASSPNTDELYENVFMLQPEQESEFQSCNATDARELLTCNDPTALKRASLVFRETAASPSSIVFSAGKTYYFIGTADGTISSLSNKIGGRCNKTEGVFYPLRLKIRVCTNEEVAVYKNCSVCDTLVCYTKGCARYTEWSKTNTYLWNGTHCLNKEIRTCNPLVGYCDQQLERNVVSSSNCTFPQGATCESKISSLYTPYVSNQASVSERITTSSQQALGMSSATQSALLAGMWANESKSVLVESRTSLTSSLLGASPSYGLSSSSITLTVSSTTVSPTPSGCTCPNKTIVVQQLTTGQQSSKITSCHSAYLIVPSIIGGIILGVAMTIAAKYIATSKSKEKVAPYPGDQAGNDTEA